MFKSLILLNIHTILFFFLSTILASSRAKAHHRLRAEEFRKRERGILHSKIYKSNDPYAYVDKWIFSQFNKQSMQTMSGGGGGCFGTIAMLYAFGSATLAL